MPLSLRVTCREVERSQVGGCGRCARAWEQGGGGGFSHDLISGILNRYNYNYTILHTIHVWSRINNLHLNMLLSSERGS